MIRPQMNSPQQNHFAPAGRGVNTLPAARGINTLNSVSIDGNPLSRLDGFALDTNNNGKYDKGSDGLLAFDLNHDGSIQDKEVQQSKNILNSLDSPTIKFFGRDIPNPNYVQAQKMGLTGDGPLTGEQIANAGGRIVVDQGTRSLHNPFGGGEIPMGHEWSTYSVYNFPTGNGERGSLSTLDPTAGYSTVAPGF